VHHPEWKAATGNLLDTLMRLGRRDEALGYLVPLGVGTCEIGTARGASPGPDDAWSETREHTGLADRMRMGMNP
jgi:hypothetical protein